MSQLKKYHLITILILVVFSCKESYEPAAITANHDFLVVEGLINSDRDSLTTISLSRTRSLTDSTYDTKPETNAQVLVEGEAGDKYALQNMSDGTYIVKNMNINPTRQYRLRIRTGGKEYLSAYVPVQASPPIDSITWEQPDNLTFFVNTHDPQNKTRYYRWDYIETWQHFSSLTTIIGVTNGLMEYLDTTITQTYNCWTSLPSTNIIISTSVQLSQDVINHFPVALIQRGDARLEVRYSMLLHQYALTEEAFNYWQILEKNTQNLGTLFDAQPSQLKGNIVCISDPATPVIGYVSVGTISSKRIFVSHGEVTNWPPAPRLDCSKPKIIDQDPFNWRIYNYSDTSYAPYYLASGAIIVAPKYCLDCRRQGGINQRPIFW